MTATIQMQKKGLITIPVEIRDRYQLDENVPLTLVDVGDGFFLSPKRSVLPKLVSEFEQYRQNNDISVEDLIEGVRQERENI